MVLLEKEDIIIEYENFRINLDNEIWLCKCEVVL